MLRSLLQLLRTYSVKAMSKLVQLLFTIMSPKKCIGLAQSQEVGQDSLHDRPVDFMR